MDPASSCVFNVTRNALLSERLVSVSEPQTPSELLAIVMNGPGRDPHSCIRLTNVSVTPDIPRLFAFDVAYLDSEQRILHCADVGPGTPFPAVTGQVATILFLSDQLLARSNTEAGDFIRVCTEAELAALLRATAQFETLQPAPFRFESESPQIASEPFDGSLIFLPASGTPQTREIFLSPDAPPSRSVDLPIEEPADVLSGPTATEPPLLAESSQSLVDSIQPPPQSESFQSGEPHLPGAPPVSRFFETGSHQPPQTSSHETRQTPSPPSQLPFNLKAVIQLVDEQLRREQQQPPTTPQQNAADKASEPTDAAPNPLAKAEIPESEIASPGIVAPEIAASEIHQQRPVSNQIEIALESVQPATTSVPDQAPVLFEPAKALPPAREATRQHLPSRPEVEIPSPAEFQPTPAKPSKEVPRPVASLAKEKLPFAARVQRWLAGESISLSGNRRRGERVEFPGLVAFYFTGGAPLPHEIVNISSSGLYLRSKDLWSPNTLVRMTLERQDATRAEPKSISVLTRVVRVDDHGIGHEFVTREVLAKIHARDVLPQEGTNRHELEKFLARSG
jgi:hypothetical protein